MKKLLLLLAVPCILFVSGCSDSEEVNPQGAESITDAQGLEIVLEWNTGSTTSKATEEADLDLYLYKDQSEVQASEFFYSFEQVTIENIYQNGDYEIDISYVGGVADVDFTLFVNSMDGKNSIQYKGSFNASEAGDGAWPKFVTISKNGTKYTIK